MSQKKNFKVQEKTFFTASRQIAATNQQKKAPSIIQSDLSNNIHPQSMRQET